MQKASAVIAFCSKQNAPINDVITVNRSGYLNYSESVTNSENIGIKIKLIVCADTVRDIDGNLYQAVRLGNQVWTVENLRTTRLRDGTTISLITDNVQWSSNNSAAYCYYANTKDIDTINKFGALYTWHTVATGKLTPAGWHIPTNIEWNTLQDHLIAAWYNWDSTNTGNKIGKAMASRTYWDFFDMPGTVGYDVTKNNRCGFTALPSGYRFNNGNFYSIGSSSYWWSATNHDINLAWNRSLSNNLDYLYSSYLFKNCGYSVRMVKD